MQQLARPAASIRVWLGTASHLCCGGMRREALPWPGPCQGPCHCGEVVRECSTQCDSRTARRGVAAWECARTVRVARDRRWGRGRAQWSEQGLDANGVKPIQNRRRAAALPEWPKNAASRAALQQAL